jgi:hypothetical protein
MKTEKEANSTSSIKNCFGCNLFVSKLVNISLTGNYTILTISFHYSMYTYSGSIAFR